MTKILPLPVKKNKFGQRVANIPTTDYYGQIMEEVLEAHIESVIAEYSTEKDDNEAEELVDIITTCVTRIDIMSFDNVEEFVNKQMEDKPKDFYRYLEQKVLNAHQQAIGADLLTKIIQDGGADEFGYFSQYCWETDFLADVIVACTTRLEQLGYDEKAREELYKAVNEKNRKRGYFEE